MSPIRTANARWKQWRICLRERMARLTPKSLIEYPFEMLMSWVSVLIGIPLIAGIARPESIALLLPVVAYVGWAVALILGGLTLYLAIRHRHAFMAAAGIQLLGGAYCIYAIALLAVVGFAGAGPAALIFMGIGVICFVRASHFRRLIDIQRGARRLEEDRELD